jgi:hypothetical protein
MPQDVRRTVEWAREGGGAAEGEARTERRRRPEGQRRGHVGAKAENAVWQMENRRRTATDGANAGETTKSQNAATLPRFREGGGSSEPPPSCSPRGAPLARRSGGRQRSPPTEPLLRGGDLVGRIGVGLRCESASRRSRGHDGSGGGDLLRARGRGIAPICTTNCRRSALVVRRSRP